MNSSNKIPISIIFGGIVVALAVYFSMARPGQPGSSGNPSLVRPVGIDDHILGNPAAQIKIISYTDFDCDYCRRFHLSMQRVVADAGANGKVAWVYRQFPLTELHPNSLKHAEASECVAVAAGDDRTAFWTFADSLFANQPVDPSRYGALAAEAGVASKAFSDCYTNATELVDARIMADRQNALDSGATGTPYSLIVVAGKTPIVMDGAYTYDAIQLILGNLLSQVR